MGAQLHERYRGRDGDLVARLHFMVEHGRVEQVVELLAAATPVEVLQAALEHRAAQVAEGQRHGTT